MTPEHNARILSCTGSMAGAWLFNIPKNEHSIMDAATFRLSCRSRLGLPLPNLPNVCQNECNCAIDKQGSHLFSCRLFISHLTNRHDALLRDFMELASSAAVKARNKQLTIFLQLDPEDRRRPDLFLSEMGTNGNDVYIDVTVGHPLLATYVKRACKERGYTLKILEEKKYRKYGVLCAEVGAEFQGFAFESYGSVSDKVLKMIQDLCVKASAISGIPYSNLLTYWKKRISTTMQKENAKFIRKVSKTILTNRFQNNFHVRVPPTECVISERVHNSRPRQ